MPAKEHSLKSVLITQAIAVFGFLIIPAAVTYVVPRTIVELNRLDNRVSARISKHILLIVPINVTSIDSVVEVESHVTSSKYGYSTETDRIRRRKVHTAADGSIWIIGREAKIQIQSTPSDAPQQESQIKEYLNDPTQLSFVMTFTAGWAFTYLLGGVMTGLSVLYCLGVVLALLRWSIRRYPTKHFSQSEIN